MALKISKRRIVILMLFYGTFFPAIPAAQKAETSSLPALLPRAAHWEIVEDVRHFGPETLYEYIDGAAEAYISYDFKELIVAQFQNGRTKSSLTAEIYDMGSDLNAFGIYSAERFPESRFLTVGIQGYVEEGSMNFLAGRYYVKLSASEGGGQTEEFLKIFAEAIVDKIQDRGGFPSLLRVFPKDGLIPNSEKFILRNFMGFKFLKNGYQALYRQAGQEFDGFFVEGTSIADAEAMWKLFLDNFIRSGPAVEQKPFGVHFKDPYFKNVYAARVGRYLCGVTKIMDGREARGEKYMEAMIKALGK